MKIVHAFLLGTLVASLVFIKTAGAQAQSGNPSDNTPGTPGTKSDAIDCGTPSTTPPANLVPSTAKNHDTVVSALNNKAAQDRGQLTAMSTEQSEALKSDAAQQAIAASQNTPDFECGAFAIPAKIELMKKQDVLAAPTGALYVGWRLGAMPGFTSPDLWKWLQTSYVVAFLGYTGNFNTQKSSTGGATGTSTTSGVTFGTGMSYQFFTSKYRIGWVVGFDDVGKTAGFQYNMRPWISAQIGTQF